MKFNSSYPQKKLLCAAISVSLLQISGVALAQSPQVEEVVVTGSFIRRTEGFRAASPITQITADDVALAGTPNMGDVIANMSFNQGSPVTQNSLTGASSTSTSVNLRGLGAGATLNLVDGMRVIGTNVNTFVPQIALARLDVVTDGAAALYGSQAVAGVVNFVPRSSYDGVRLEAYQQGDDRGDYKDTLFSALGGTEWNGLNIVVAGEWRDNGALRMRDRPDQMNAGLTSSSTSNPGNYTVPLRDAAGNLRRTSTGALVTTVLPDPGCGVTREDPTKQGANPNGFLFSQTGTAAGTRCWYDYGEFWDYRTAANIGTAFLNLSYDVSPDLSLSAQTSFFARRAYNRGSASNPGGRVSELPVIRGELPGNPYRAKNAAGQPLFARDANADGIPDRAANGDVILDPNGIAFNEDVRFAAWRPWGKQGTLPSQLSSDGSLASDTYIRGYRQAFKADFAVPFIEDWRGIATYTYSSQLDKSLAPNFSLGAITQGLNCDVVKNREACFNPFVATSPAVLNTQAVADSTVLHSNRINETTTLQTFDLVVNGDLPLGGFELPGGPIASALGYQRRADRFNNIPSLHSLTGDVFIGTKLFPTSDGRHVDSLFAEFSLPLLDNLELQLAVRNEDYSTGQSSTDPKYGIVYTPIDRLTLRASAGTSFVAPTLDQLNAPESCGLTNVSDPFTTFAAFTANCSRGNPNLVPESADTLSVGFELDLIEGMKVSIDWSETDFTDRIVSSTTADVLATDYFNFRQATGYTGTAKPSLAQVAAWVADPRSDKRIQRNPGAVDQIDRIISGSSNASSMLVRATDLKFSYNFPMADMGLFSVSLDGTYIDSYQYQLRADRPVVEAAGLQNNNTGATPPMPRWKANLSLGWSSGQHSANVTTRYIHHMVFDADPFAYQARLPFSNFRNPSELRASTIVDASYNFSQYEAMGGEFAFTVGARNLFDRLPQKVPMLGGMESVLYDPTGRMLYARVTYEL
ncbi:MAG: TonB-dependent receptor [Gammaproteobacteria bacterium]|nr:TonB-dependent receptor [Gammaproteobacteria bacterium]MDP2347601.1 TonB-dependent receptor [Gammaproteobacteria bacterium]